MTQPDRTFVSRFEDRIPFLYFEHCHVVKEDSALVVMREGEKIQIPAAALGVLMLGPGTKVSQQAMIVLGECGCPVAWCGGNGIRLYSFSQPLSGDTKLLEAQARAWSDPSTRLLVAKHLFRRRFGSCPDVKTIDELRGHEGAISASLYREAAQQAGVNWEGRQTDLPWAGQDAANRAVSVAMSCVYAVCGAAVLATGCTPGLGFFHVGRPLSFVYDIADLFRFELAVPLAFTHCERKDLEREIRELCGKDFMDCALVSQTLDMIAEVLVA